MGRPLFSKRTSAEPAVRVEPEPAVPEHPTYEKWTYLNAFDPDSDEFFENDNAVYEAFIEHDMLPPLSEVREASEGDEETSRASGMPVDDGASTISSGSSEADSVIDESLIVSRGASLADRVYTAPPLPPQVVRDIEHYAVIRAPDSERRYIDTARLARSLSPLSDDDDRVDTPVTPPIERPSTPPNQSTSVQFNGTPSPPPTVTPRLYSWPTRTLPLMPHSPTGPLTNRNARMSVAHIRPAALTVNRVIG